MMQWLVVGIVAFLFIPMVIANWLHHREQKRARNVYRKRLGI